MLHLSILEVEEIQDHVNPKGEVTPSSKGGEPGIVREERTWCLVVYMSVLTPQGSEIPQSNKDLYLSVLALIMTSQPRFWSADYQ